MNLIILLVILLAGISPAVTNTAHTYLASNEQEYAVVSTDEAYLYIDSSLHENSKLFIVPKTYFLKVLQKTDSYYKVEYAFDSAAYCPIIGYMNSSSILISTPKTQPYNFEHKLDKISNPILYSDISLQQSQMPIMLDKTYFYGKITNNNELLYFVRYTDYVGYVKASSFKTFDIANHPDYVPPQKPVPPDNSGDNSNNNIQIEGSKNNTIEIIMIVAICVPALIIVILLFKTPKKPKPHTDIYHRDVYPPYDRDNYKD